MNTVLRKSLTIISCVVGRATATASKRSYCHADIPGMQTSEAGTNGKDNIRSRRILFLPDSKRLPDNSFEAISLHRAANLAMNADPQPARACCILPADQGKAFTMQTFSAAVDVFELPPLAQQRTFGKTFTGQRLSRKSFTAFSPTRR